MCGIPVSWDSWCIDFLGYCGIALRNTAVTYSTVASETCERTGDCHVVQAQPFSPKFWSLEKITDL